MTKGQLLADHMFQAYARAFYRLGNDDRSKSAVEMAQWVLESQFNGDADEATLFMMAFKASTAASPRS